MIQHEVSLAWALALTAKPHLDDVERNDIFVQIGAGETFAAIRELLKWVATKRIPLGPDLVQWCVSWLDAYVGHEDERYLRRLIEDVVSPIAIQAWARFAVNRLSTSPQRRDSRPCLPGSEADRTREFDIRHRVSGVFDPDHARRGLTPTARVLGAATSPRAARNRRRDASDPARSAAAARSPGPGGLSRRP